MHKVSLNWKTTKIRYCAQTFDKYCIPCAKQNTAIPVEEIQNTENAVLNGPRTGRSMERLPEVDGYENVSSWTVNACRYRTVRLTQSNAS